MFFSIFGKFLRARKTRSWKVLCKGVLAWTTLFLCCDSLLLFYFFFVYWEMQSHILFKTVLEATSLKFVPFFFQSRISFVFLHFPCVIMFHPSVFLEPLSCEIAARFWRSLVMCLRLPPPCVIKKQLFVADPMLNENWKTSSMFKRSQTSRSRRMPHSTDLPRTAMNTPTYPLCF